MEGFRERMGNRYDRAERSAARSERTSEDRYERAPRREGSVGVEAISTAIDKSNKEQLEVIYNLFDDVRADIYDSEKAIIAAIPQTMGQVRSAYPGEVPQPVVRDEALDRSVNELKGGIGEVLSRLNAMETSSKAPSDDTKYEELANKIEDNRSLLHMVRQDILNSTATVSEEEVDSAETLSAEMAKKYYSDLEEHVHKESVKCYKNVQAALVDANAESSAKIAKSVSATKVIAIISLVLNVLTMGGLVYMIISSI